MSVPEGFSPTEFISRRKMIQKVNQRIERFAWSEAEGRLIPDRRGDIVFLRDVVRIIEGDGVVKT